MGTLALKVDSEIEARIRNDALLKRLGLEIGEKYKNVPD